MRKDTWFHDLYLLFRWPTAVFLFHIFANLFVDIYRQWPSADIPMHFAGGFSIALMAHVGFGIAGRRKLVGKMHPAVLIFLNLGVVMMVAVWWEFFEFSLDQIFFTNAQLSLVDTMGDLLLGFLGGLTGAVAKQVMRK